MQNFNAVTSFAADAEKMYGVTLRFFLSAATVSGTGMAR
jgi:hypothetical protein